MLQEYMANGELFQYNCHGIEPTVMEKQQRFNDIRKKLIEERQLHCLDSVVKLIWNAERVIIYNGLTFEALEVFFNNMVKCITNKLSRINIDNPIIPKDFTEPSSTSTMPKCKWTNYSYIYNNYVVAWLACDKLCPFRHPDDDGICGTMNMCFYKVSTGKFLFTNNLLFHQIVVHHFFQSPKIETKTLEKQDITNIYHIDPEYLLNFFDLLIPE